MSKNVKLQINFPSGNGRVLYSGSAAECPPIPRIGEKYRGEFGGGLVSEVSHYPDDDAYYNILVRLRDPE